MFSVRGLNGSASMSATEWIGASHVIRSWWAARIGSVSSVSLGSSIHASGNASTMRSYSAGSAGLSTIVPSYWPFKSTESTAPSATSAEISRSSHEGVGSSLKRSPGAISRRRMTGSSEGGSPRRSEATNVTGRGSRASAACSVVPAWRSARSSAAESNAQLRYSRNSGRAVGCGNRSSERTRSAKLSSVKSPVSGSVVGERCSAS